MKTTVNDAQNLQITSPQPPKAIPGLSSSGKCFLYSQMELDSTENPPLPSLQRNGALWLSCNGDFCILLSGFEVASVAEFKANFTQGEFRIPLLIAEPEIE
ncbi:hypothetical protein COLO4_12935 [Corchorus olitorius]|uniref:Uncharacterized protein n=1 Tax=Corchorus olitorius TaxID=93759 RepID=A0A1R3JZ26_9ROSI|nr:hypothetical protein COLO4_12935 [Corchorus olitorius]